jgi:beta-glucosidase
MGLVDMLLARPGKASLDFKGRLPFDWPSGDCLPRFGGIEFHRGYGLSLARRSRTGRLPETPPVMACPQESR